MPEFEAVLFDFDGVLVDSEPVHCDCWREALAPLGVNVTWEVYATHCVGAADSSMMPVFAKLADPPADPVKLWERYPLKKQLFQQRMANNPPFADGVGDFFRELSTRYKLGVVSSSAHVEIDPLLVAAGIMPYLSTVVCGGDVKRHKPNPEPYILAGRNLGIRRALAVEDSPPGMQSAREAGFDVIQITDPARMMERVRARLNGGY
ncbi:MAG TPA: HAD family phosphatase [Bryobacteraceae bacterium]|nr:HAD family phosphatase [Bryobacteraceae bacterium]